MVKLTQKIMEMMRGIVTTSAANVYTEDDFTTPVRYKDNEAMLIWDIWFDISTFDGGNVDDDQIGCHLSAESQETLSRYNEDDEIAHFIRTLSTSALGEIVTEEGKLHQHFDPPILYAKDKIYFATDSNGIATVTASKFKIGYTIERVSDQVFIDALTT